MSLTKKIKKYPKKSQSTKIKSIINWITTFYDIENKYFDSIIDFINYLKLFSLSYTKIHMVSVKNCINN